MRFTSSFCGLFFYVFVLLTATAAMSDTREILAAMTGIACLFYFARDYFDPRPKSITVMSFYALWASIWFAFSNLVGYLAADTRYERMFYTYDVPEYILSAQLIASLAAVLPPVIYDVVKKNFGEKPIIHLPKIGFDMPDWLLLRFCLGFYVIGWGLRFVGVFSQIGFGTIGDLLNTGPNIAIFALSSRWLAPPPPEWSRRLRWLPLALMLLELSFHSAFSGMRSNIAWPLVAYCLPYIIYRRVTLARAFVGLTLVLGFIFFFKQLNSIRFLAHGSDRVEVLMQQMSEPEDYNAAVITADEEASDSLGLMQITARFSTFNQLSQVCRLAADEGYYNGETLSYVMYVFIPRIIWPDKPTVAPGQWFARKLGRGQEVGSGRFSNAINMTIPGELYLNFGWSGVILGLSFLSALYFFLWHAASYFTEPRNVLGQSMSFVLLAQAIFNGSHFGAVVNLVIWYVFMLTLSALALFLAGKRHWQLPAPSFVSSDALNEPGSSASPVATLAAADWQPKTLAH